MNKESKHAATDGRAEAIRYFKSLKANFPGNFAKNTRFVCVGHITAENNLLMRELLKHGKVTLIPKGTIEKPQDVEELRHIKGLRVVDRNKLPPGKLREFRESIHDPDNHHELKKLLKNPELAIEMIKQYSNPGEEIMILDIGGYFAKALPDIELATEGRHPHGYTLDRKIKGVTEITVNGESKYQLAAEHTKIPVLSLAKSKTKHPENEIVGSSCVRGTEQILDRMPDLRSQSAASDASHGVYGVFAVGNVGSQIAAYLKNEMNVTPSVYDTSERRMEQAREAGYVPKPRDKLLAESDVLYVAPPFPVLSIDDFKKMKDGVILSFATSIDDVVKDYAALKKIPHESVIDHQGIEICRRYHIDGKTVNLIANGRSPNFYLDRPIDPTVILSLGLVFPAFAQILNESARDHAPRVDALDTKTQDRILEIWRDHYPDAYKKVDFSPVDVKDSYRVSRDQETSPGDKGRS